MIRISEAQAIVQENTPPLSDENVLLKDAAGRVLVEDVYADMDLPPFDRSQMDGYAVKANDTKNAPVKLTIVGESAAGKSWQGGELKEGEAVRIMTGAAVPKGADAVQKLELASENGETVEIFEAAEKKQNIVARAAEIEKGKIVLPKGDAITPSTVAILAAFGCAKVKVGKRPRVAVMSTGNEIVDVDETPQPDQIRNSNTPMLAVYAEQCGAVVKTLPIAGDEIEHLKSQIENANCDVLILTGGVSVGKYDLTKTALKELGAKIYFDKVALRPGKPTVFARLNDTLIFGLPGNPVSAAVTFHLFVRVALLQMQGATQPGLKSGTAVLGKSLKGAKERDSYVPAKLATDKKGSLIANPVKWGGSSDFISFAQADVLVFVPRGEILEEKEAAEIVFLL